MILTPSMLSTKFSRRQFEIFFSDFFHKIDFVSIGDNLLEMSKPIFSEKNQTKLKTSSA